MNEIPQIFLLQELRPEIPNVVVNDVILYVIKSQTSLNLNYTNDKVYL